MDDLNHDARDEEVMVGTHVGHSAIRWSAIVFIVVAVLYFLARYVIPLLS